MAPDEGIELPFPHVSRHLKKRLIFLTFIAFSGFPTQAQNVCHKLRRSVGLAGPENQVGELTELDVKRAKEGRHADGDGLMLVVRASAFCAIR